MIDKRENPIAWALLGYELSDAQEHLAQLCQQMQEDSGFDEIDFRIGLAHIYAHLNQAWNCRTITDAQVVAEKNQATRNIYSRFPTDIEPL